MLNNAWRVALPLLIVLKSLVSLSFGVDAPVDVRRFPASPGDTLLIQMDYGQVTVHPRASDQLETHFTRRANDARRFDDIEIASQKHNDKIHLNVYFYNYQGESVVAEIWAPPELNVVIWGANPDVRIVDRSGYVRVHSLTGAITAEDLTSSVSLITESGNIVYRSRKQPRYDARIETVSGSILCELKDDLNFRGWARAGGKLKWNSEVEMDQGSLERQIGLGGPLCYASSLRGPVEFRISAELETGQPVPAPPELTSTTPQPTPTGDQNVVEPEDQPEAQAPSASPTTVETQPADQAPVTKDPSGAYSTGYKLRLDVDWIYLNASVRERKTNRSVPNLRQSDFRVYEDGTEQTIGKFLQTEEPFHLLLLLDVSGSTQDYLDLIKDASIGFTRELGPEDKIAIATFNSDFRLRQDFTGDRKRAVEAIRGIRSGGGTAVYDALFESVNHVRRVDGRKAIVLFSDGVDNQLQGYGGEGSRATFDQLYREIQEVDALIYTIFLDTESTGGWTGGGSGTVIDILGDILRGGRRPGGRYPRPPVYRRDNSYEEARRQMEMIAEQTGARMYAPDRISDLATVYSEIANDLRVQYTLGYNSTNPNSDGSWREVKVSIVNRPDLVVRTRKGYYARQLTTAEKR